MKHERLTLTLLSALTLSSGCDSDNSQVPEASGENDDSGLGLGADANEPRDRPELVGTFVVDMQSEREDARAFGVLIGRVYDGPVPSAAPFEVAVETDGCQLLVPAHPFCDPPCGGSGACTSENVCVRYPASQDLGTLEVTGLGEPFSLKPSTNAFVYQSATLPFPPCAAGAAISIGADALALNGTCIAPLELTTPDPIEVRIGRAVQLEWTAAKAGASRVQIALDISHHGGAKGRVVCDEPDIGSFEIPEPLVSQLISLGVAGFPDIKLARVSRTAATRQPRVTLEVSSSVQRVVDIGLTSCFTDDDCKEQSMRCDKARFVCE